MRSLLVALILIAQACVSESDPLPDPEATPAPDEPDPAPACEGLVLVPAVDESIAAWVEAEGVVVAEALIVGLDDFASLPLPAGDYAVRWEGFGVTAVVEAEVFAGEFAPVVVGQQP